MTRRLADEIQQLNKTNPPLDEAKLKRHMGNLERISKFYQDKAETATEGQAVMFKSFFTVVIYAISIIKMYRKLTIRLAELAKESDHENIT